MNYNKKWAQEEKNFDANLKNSYLFFKSNVFKSLNGVNINDLPFIFF